MLSFHWICLSYHVQNALIEAYKYANEREYSENQSKVRNPI